MKLFLIGLSLAAAILAAIGSLLWLADRSCAVTLDIETISCLLKQKELAGGLIGAGGTIFAAWMAWQAIRRQIAASRSYETDLIATVIEEFTPLADLLNEMSIALAYAVDQSGLSPEEQLSRLTAFKTSLAWTHPPAEYFATLDDLGAQLPPQTKNRFRKLMERVRLFIRRLETLRVDDNQYKSLGERLHELKLARLQLAFVKLYLDRFDAGLGKRVRNIDAPINHDTWAEQLRGQIELWLEEERRRKSGGF